MTEPVDPIKGKPSSPLDSQVKLALDQPLRELADEDLQTILENHAVWVESKTNKKWRLATDDKKDDWVQGRASLAFYNLENKILEKKDLHDANFHQAILEGAKLKQANFGGADLTKALLHKADFREAILWDADLSNARGLLVHQLAGANVAGAKLPESIGTFKEGLMFVEEIAKGAKRIFLGLLAGCAYSVLTIYATSDVQLLTNSSSSKLPIIGTGIPIAGFFGVAPALLLATFIYFNLYLEKLWKGLAQLPAIFPNGRPLDEEAYPWLGNGLVRWYFHHLKDNQPFVVHLQNIVVVILFWIIPPFTIALFWLRSLQRHQWFLTIFQIAFVVLAIVCAMWFKKRAKLVLCGASPKPITFKNGSWKTADPYRQTVHQNWKLVGATVVMFLLTWVISDGAINGIRVTQDTSKKAGSAESEVSPLSHRAIVPQALPYIGARAFAEVPESDLSSRPDSWTGQKGQEVDLVKGASLRKMDLRHANMRQTFLVKADLIGARLEGSLLMGANLQQALLVGAQLQRADLTGANLRKADLSQANFQETSLFGTDLREAILPWANLEGADLAHTDLQGANLSRERGQAYRSPLKWVKNTYVEFDPKPTTLRNAHLRFTDLKGVDLSDVRGLTQEQINQACMNEETKLPNGLKRPPPCQEPEAKKKEKQ